MYEKDLVESSFNLKDAWETLMYKRAFRIENPNYLEADGLIVFTGSQGSGKTLTAVRYACDVMDHYQHCKLVTNLMIKDYPIVSLEEYIRRWYGKSTAADFSKLSPYWQSVIIEDYMHLNRVFPFNDGDDLMRYSNLDEGVIFLIDEIQLYFNSLQSKNINMDVMTEISQQRKQRKHIIATSQVFGRLAKPLREQFNTVVQCRCYLGILQRNLYMKNDDVNLDDDAMHIKGKVDKVQIFFHKVRDYERYDTYYKVEKGKFLPGEERNMEIYERYTTGRDAGGD